MPSKVNWQQAFAEVSLLIVGAALALSADSWADSKRERAEERDYLASLLADFQATDSIFRANLADQDNLIRHGRFLIQTLAAEPGSVPVDSLDRMVRKAFLWSKYSPVLATYEDMVNSGDLRLIRNDSLRAAMADFASWMEVVSAFNDATLEMWSDLVTPFFIRHFDFTDLYGPDSAVDWGTGTLPGYEWGPQLTRIESAEEAYWSREFVNILAVYMASSVDTSRLAGQAVTRLERILSTLEAELATGA